MQIVFELQGYVFDWDATKAAGNIEKHGITFEEATEVFLDPFVQFGDALEYSGSERLLLVVHVERGVRYGLISARKATPHQRSLYDDR